MFVRMIVPVVRRRRAALAVDPARVAASVMFFFPDRNPVFDFIDDVSTRIECFAPVGGADAHPNGHVGEIERADTMDARGMFNGKTLQCFGKYAVALFDGKGLKGFVLESSDVLALVMIPNPALEAHVAAGAAVEQFPARGLRIDGRLGEAKAHQPPATGGMNTTSSPVLKGRDHSENSLFTATFNCSRDNVKP